MKYTIRDSKIYKPKFKIGQNVKFSKTALGESGGPIKSGPEKLYCSCVNEKANELEPTKYGHCVSSRDLGKIWKKYETIDEDTICIKFDGEKRYYRFVDYAYSVQSLRNKNLSTFLSQSQLKID